MSDFGVAQYIIDEVLKGIEIRTDLSHGLPPDNMAMAKAIPGNGKVDLYFREPEDTVIDGRTLCTVKGVKVVVKEGSAPESELDGKVILDCTEPGRYADKPFTYTGVQNGKTYYFGLFPYSDHAMHNRSRKNVLTAQPKDYVLYGFRIDKDDPDPLTRVTYMEDNQYMAPAHMDYAAGVFDYGDWRPDEVFFLKNNKPYMVKSDGTLDYELDENNYDLRADGAPSDVSNVNYDGNAMARMDTVWLRQYEDDRYEYCYISDKQVTSEYHAYAHQRADGSVMDYVLLSMFEPDVQSNKLRIIKGLTPQGNISAANEAAYAAANGILWAIRSWAQRNLINMLLQLMGRTDDFQTTYGNGYYTGGSSSSPGLLKAGAGFDKGRFWGANTKKNVVKVFHIENWWGNTQERIQGLVNNKGIIMAKMTPPYNAETLEGYVNTGLVPAGSSGGYIDKTSMTQYGRIGYNAMGSQGTYACDGLYYNNKIVSNAMVGGSGGSSWRCGANYISFNVAATAAGGWSGGVGLSCEQKGGA